MLDMKVNTNHVIVTHGRLAEGYIDAIYMLTQKEGVNFINAYIEGDLEEQIVHTVSSFPKENRIIFFSDLFSGSVTQKIIELYGHDPRITIISGINLPIVLEIILKGDNFDEASLDSLIEMAREEIRFVNSNDIYRDIT